MAFFSWLNIAISGVLICIELIKQNSIFFTVDCLCITEGMAAQGVDSVGSLTRRHRVKVVAAASVEDCILAIGEVVGHKSILVASRMSNAVVCFLNTVDNANNVVEREIVIRGLFTHVLSLSTPARKVILSNVPLLLKMKL